MTDNYFRKGTWDFEKTKVVATHRYPKPDGSLNYELLRGKGPGDEKPMLPKRPNLDGERDKSGKFPDFLYNTTGLTLYLYRVDELIKSTAETIYIAEGEKDVDALVALGLTATCNPNGAGRGRWRPEYSLYFADRDVAVIADHDAPGYAHAERVARSVQPFARSVRVVPIGKMVAADPDRVVPPPDGYDVSDWIAEWKSIQATANRGDRKKSPHKLKEEIVDALKALVRRCSDFRPTYIVRTGNDAELMDLAEDALIGAKAPVFSRGEKIVIPRIETVPAGGGRKTKIGRTVAITPVNLSVEQLSKVANWQRYPRPTRQNPIPVPEAANVPDKIAVALVNKGGGYRLRPLAGIYSCPTMRPDGSLVLDVGYDRSTGLYLIDVPSMPAIPLKPSRADAERALAVLDSLLDGFPFVDAASRSVALSAMMTVVIRGACTAVPLHAFNAPAAGTGKSHLTDTVSAIAIGSKCAVISMGSKTEEFEKRLGAVMMAAQALVSIDNLNGALGGDTICQMVERPMVDVRVLGKSELVRVENRATVFANGNNLTLTGDIVRRAITCNLDARVEAPELRSFKFDPFDEVMKDRGLYIAAILTIVRAYLAAGKPGVLRRLGSFGEWSDLVRSPLVWLGRADPCDTMEEARRSDPERLNIATVINALRDVIGEDKPTPVGEIVGIANGSETMMMPDGSQIDDVMRVNIAKLQTALMTVAADQRGRISNVRLGMWLTRYRGRISGGYRLVGETSSTTNQKLWSIERCEGGEAEGEKAEENRNPGTYGTENNSI